MEAPRIVRLPLQPLAPLPVLPLRTYNAQWGSLDYTDPVLFCVFYSPAGSSSRTSPTNAPVNAGSSTETDPAANGAASVKASFGLGALVALATFVFTA